MTAAFVQASTFTADLKRLDFTLEDLAELEKSIMKSPAGPPVMGGTGGLRKIRFAPPSYHTGKRGACRICYAWFPADAIVYMVVAFGKNEKENLSNAEKASIRKLLAEIQLYLTHRRQKHGKSNG